MKLHYDKETDSLYIDLNARPGVDSREIQDGLVIDLDAQGRIVGIDIQHASQVLDLATLETESLPAATQAHLGRLPTAASGSTGTLACAGFPRLVIPNPSPHLCPMNAAQACPELSRRALLPARRRQAVGGPAPFPPLFSLS